MTAVVLRGDARALPLPDASVDLVVTSPPYFGLRSYTDGGEHYDGQIGSESTPQEWLAVMTECVAEMARVLKPSGSIFLNVGDKYAGSNGMPGCVESSGLAKQRGGSNPQVTAIRQRRPPATGAPAKSLLGLPWRLALACTDQLGLILRRDIIWSKPNGLPESVTDRCRSSHEYLFHLTKSPRYYAAVDEIREAHTGGSNHARRDGVAPPGGKLERMVAAGERGGTVFGTNPDLFNPLGKLPGSVWSIPSQPLTVPAHLGTDHFAAFPMELPRRCILGWSPPGICTACGEGRRPVTNRSDVPFNYRLAVRTVARARDTGGVDRSTLGRAASETAHAITGYACACPDTTAPTRPSLIVDPFGGTGTTSLVASVLGRTGVSIDRSMDYTRLARWRTTDPAERARAMQVPKPPPVPAGQVSLFDLDAS